MKKPHEQRSIIPPKKAKAQFGTCEHCKNVRIIRKVKYESETGIGSMWICDKCDNS